MSRLFVLVAILIVISSAASTPQVYGDYWLVELARTIDGDTFETTEGLKVRILGIDACEDDLNATRFLDSILHNQPLKLTFDLIRTNESGCTLASVETADNHDVGAMMVFRGYALTYFKYPYENTDRYMEIERTARETGLGIWQGHLYVHD